MSETFNSVETYEKLSENSISAFWAAIEIHNKPHFPYRYETVIILVINSWELILKAYILRFLPLISIFNKDGRSKSLEDCISTIFGILPKEFYPVRDNLLILNKIRNEITHFNLGDLNIIVFSLIIKNVQFYSEFMKSFFEKDLSEDSDLILLPIGFIKFISPIDYLSNKSVLENADESIKSLLTMITVSIKSLLMEGIEESILVDYNIHLNNTRNIKNSDLAIRIDPEAKLGMHISKKLEVGILTNNPNAPEVSSRSFSIAPSNDMEDVISWIALSDRDNSFLPQENRLWEKYLIRKELKLSYNQIYKLVYFSIMQKIAISYWLNKLKLEDICKIVDACITDASDLFVKTYCRNIIDNYHGEEPRRIFNKLNNGRYHKSFKKGLIDTRLTSIITRVEKEFGGDVNSPLFLEFLEIKLNRMINELKIKSEAILSVEIRELDRIIYLILFPSSP